MGRDRTAADVLLADGTLAYIRPVRPDDRDALADLHRRVSDRSMYLRYFTLNRQHATKYVEGVLAGGAGRQTLVAIVGGEIVGVAGIDAIDADSAEIAFLIDDAHQAKGIGTLLLEYLAVLAEQAGYRRLVGVALPDNALIHDVLRWSGFDVTLHRDQGSVDVEFPVGVTDRLLRAVAERERLADARSMMRLLTPRVVAVIGASRRPGGAGHEVFRRLIDGRFAGEVYAVNRQSGLVAGRPAYPTIHDVPARVDLAVIAVPAPAVLDVVRQCGQAGVADLLVISSGFAEAGGSGGQAQEELVAEARRHGMRLVGPNCIGIANTAPDVRLDATFLPIPILPGRLGLGAQSGALGIVVVERASELGLGVSTFVSMGNMADVGTNDLLMYWEQDTGTDLVALYLESVGDPRTFARVARRMSRTKPILALISGRSEAGARAATSHTAHALSSTAAVEALFRQTGVIRVTSLQEMLQLAAALASQPLPNGRRVAIVGNSGGPGALAADACVTAGLQVVNLDEPTRQALQQAVPDIAAAGNPVDLGAGTTVDRYRRALDIILAGGVVDAVIVVAVPVLGLNLEALGRELVHTAVTADTPLLAVFLDQRGDRAPLDDHIEPGRPWRRVPVFGFPEHAAHALGRIAEYADWRRRPLGEIPDPCGIDRAAAARLVTAELGGQRGGGWLDWGTAARLLGAYGISCVPTVHAAGLQPVVEAAQTVGFPVALKVADPNLVHKTELGGVRLGLCDEQQLRAAYAEMVAGLPVAEHGVLVQRMAPAGVETIVGVVQDVMFGPLVLFGLGGVTTEVLGDRAFRVLPMTDIDAADLVRSLRGSALLQGHRGAPPADLAALEDLLLRVGQLAYDLPEMAELDLNPVIALPNGLAVVDVKIRLTRAAPRRSELLRRLPDR